MSEPVDISTIQTPTPSRSDAPSAVARGGHFVSRRSRFPAHPAFFAWVKRHFNRYDIAEQTDDVWRCNPTEFLERHLNLREARGGWGFLPDLKSRQLRQHRAGAVAFGLKPRRVSSDNETKIRAVIRIDVDEHDGQRDGANLIRRISQQAGFDSLYVEPSPRGWSGYAAIVYPLTVFNIEGERRTSPSKAKINLALDQFQVALRQLAKQWGFLAGVEVSGRLATYRRDEETRTWTINPGERGDAIRLPRCVNQGDVEALVAAEVPVSAVHAVIKQVFPSWSPAERGLLPAPAAAPKSKMTYAARVKKLERIADCGDKHKNTLRALGSALRQLGDSATNEEVVELANSIYESRGYAGGSRDESRNQRFKRSLAFVRRTNTSREGDDPLWFGEDDLFFAADRIAGSISNATIDRVNDENRAALDGAHICRFGLALVLCTTAKNSASSEGEVPVTSIVGMLRHFGLRANGSYVRLARELLVTAGLAECLTRSYVPGRRSMKWAVKGAALFLPFITDEEGLEEARRAYRDRKALRAKATGEGARAGAGTNAFIGTSMMAVPTFEKVMDALFPEADEDAGGDFGAEFGKSMPESAFS